MEIMFLCSFAPLFQGPRGPDGVPGELGTEGKKVKASAHPVTRDIYCTYQNLTLINVSLQGPDGPPGKIGFPGHAVKNPKTNIYDCVSTVTVAMSLQSLIDGVCPISLQGKIGESGDAGPKGFLVCFLLKFIYCVIVISCTFLGLFLKNVIFLRNNHTCYLYRTFRSTIKCS